VLEEAKGLYARYYGPGNASLFIAGDVTKDEARALLEKAFGGWEGAPSFEKVSAPVPLDPENRALRLVLVDVPGAVQTDIRFVMPGPLAGDSDRVRYDLLNGVLGGGFTSRLNQNLREEKGLTYGAGSSFNRSVAAGYFWASSDVHAEATGTAVREFLAEFDRIRKGDITEEEAKKARETLRMETVGSFEGLGGLLRAAEGCVANGLPFSSIGDDLAAMASLGAPDLNALAPKAIPMERALLLLLGDKGVIEKQLEGLPLPKPEERDKRGNPVAARP
jgi:predicted Zn-dependent peptidase